MVRNRALAVTEDDYEGPETIARRMHLILPNDPKKVAWDWLVILVRSTHDQLDPHITAAGTH